MTNNRCLLLLVLEKQVVALEEKEEGKSGRERKGTQIQVVRGGQWTIVEKTRF